MGGGRYLARHVALLIGALEVLPGCARVLPATPYPTSGGPAAGAVAAVTRVSDGDTFHVQLGGRDERVRVIGIDTPEVAAYAGRGACYGAEAARYTAARLAHRTVRLVFDVDRRDRYGRLLAYVYLGTELFNLTLVRAGYARVEPVPPDTRFAPLFASAQAAARRSRAGLWSACNA